MERCPEPAASNGWSVPSVQGGSSERTPGKRPWALAAPSRTPPSTQIPLRTTRATSSGSGASRGRDGWGGKGPCVPRGGHPPPFREKNSRRRDTHSNPSRRGAGAAPGVSASGPSPGGGFAGIYFPATGGVSALLQRSSSPGVCCGVSERLVSALRGSPSPAERFCPKLDDRPSPIARRSRKRSRRGETSPYWARPT